MLKRKEFILGAAAGLAFAAAATAGGVIDWPDAHAEPGGRIIPSAGAPGVAFAPPQGAPRSFADIFDQVAPAVVQIDVKTRIEAPQGGFFQIPGLPGFGFQAPDTEEPEESEPQTALGAGSGFFISADGFIVTNNHVVEDAEEITVRLNDEREFPARVVGRDPDTDLAVIKIEGGNFPFVTFEEAAEPRVGDWVIAVGNPFGLGGTATAGIVSAKARDINDARSPYTDFLQIDAAINRGNSGGPTFDIYGRVIGVNSAIYSPTGTSVGIGFAIPATIAKPITERLMRGEKIERGYLGVTITALTDDFRRSLGLPEDAEGAYVVDVNADGPAAQAGLRSGDIVVEANGEPISNQTELTRVVGAVQPGSNIRLEILREGRRQTVNVRSGTRPAGLSARPLQGEPEGGPAAPTAPSGEVVEGLTVTPLTAALREQFSVPAGVQGLVVTNVARGSQAARDRLQPGFVIIQANGRPVATAADLRAQVAAVRQAGRDGIFLLIRTPSGNVPWVLELSED